MLNLNPKSLLNVMFKNIESSEINSASVKRIADLIEKSSRDFIAEIKRTVKPEYIDSVGYAIKLANAAAKSRGTVSDEKFIFSILYSGYELLSPPYIDDNYDSDYIYLKEVVSAAKEAIRYSGYELVIASVLGGETDKWEFGKNEKWSDKVLKLSPKSFYERPDSIRI